MEDCQKMGDASTPPFAVSCSTLVAMATKCAYYLGDRIGYYSTSWETALAKAAMYMSLFFVLMKGEFNNILQWTVTFKIINQEWWERDVGEILQPVELIPSDILLRVVLSS